MESFDKDWDPKNQRRVYRGVDDTVVAASELPCNSKESKEPKKPIQPHNPGPLVVSQDNRITVSFRVGLNSDAIKVLPTVSDEVAAKKK